MREDRLEIDTHADVVVHGMAPADGHHIVRSREGTGGLVVLVVTRKTPIAAELEAEGEGANPLKGVAICRRPEIRTGKHIHKAKGQLVVQPLAYQRRIAQGHGQVCAIKREEVKAHTCGLSRGWHVEDGQRRHAGHLGACGSEAEHQQDKSQDFPHLSVMH